MEYNFFLIALGAVLSTCLTALTLIRPFMVELSIYLFTTICIDKWALNFTKVIREAKGLKTMNCTTKQKTEIMWTSSALKARWI